MVDCREAGNEGWLIDFSYSGANSVRNCLGATADAQLAVDVVEMLVTMPTVTISDGASSAWGRADCGVTYIDFRWSYCSCARSISRMCSPAH